MVPWLPILIFGGFLALVIVIFAYSQYLARKRQEAMQAVADELGFEFKAEVPAGLTEEFERLPLFSRGRHRKVYNLLEGTTSNLRVQIFDYRFTTGAGKNQSTYNQTVICMRSRSLKLPVFTLQPEHFLHRIGEWFGIKDINFESHPNFSRSYHLISPQEELVRALFTPEVLEFFEEHPGHWVEAGGQLWVLYRPNVKIPPEQIRDTLQEAFEIFAQFRNDRPVES